MDGLKGVPLPLRVPMYRGADKSLARPQLKKQLKGHHFSSDTEIIAAAETWLDGKHSELFLSGLQKLEFGHCSLFLPGRAKDYKHPDRMKYKHFCSMP